MSEWQPIETAPRDGTVFLARDADCVFSAFYKKNPNYRARRAETLQIITTQAHHYSSGDRFHPTHWMPLSPEPPL